MGDVADVTDTIRAFEQHNTVHIAVELTVAHLGHVPRLQMVLTAYNPVGIGVEPAPLASVQLDCMTANLKTLAAALTHGLYALDFQLALNEFEGTKKPSA